MNLIDSAELEQMEQQARRQAEIEALPSINFFELENRIRRWMLLADEGVIKFLCAVYIANQLPKDPVWVFLIGPSGGGKTELLNGLMDLPKVYPMSVLTSNTFASGLATSEASLLPKINGKILIFKDWTNILSMNKEARAEIMGQLREIYDGAFKKEFGNGRCVNWRGKIGIIAGTTSVIDLSQQIFTTLGERFIHYRICQPPRLDVARRSLMNWERQNEMRLDIRNAFCSYFKKFKIDEEKIGIKLKEEIQNELIQIANFVTLARSGVIRESSPRREILFIPAAEMPTRITTQLMALAQAYMIINQDFTTLLPEDKRALYKVAMDSVPETNRMVLQQLGRRQRQTTQEIATQLGYPTTPIRLYLENLTALGICHRLKGQDTEEGGNADRWEIKDEFLTIIKKFENIQMEEQQPILPHQEVIDPFGEYYKSGSVTDPDFLASFEDIKLPYEYEEEKKEESEPEITTATSASPVKDANPSSS